MLVAAHAGHRAGPCQGGDLTITGGTVYQVFHTSQDARGIEHVTGIITPRHVTLTDAAGNAYPQRRLLVCAQCPSETDITVATDAEHFVIHAASGGVHAKVQAIEHFNVTPGGKVNVKSFNPGNCQPPLRAELLIRWGSAAAELEVPDDQDGDIAVGGVDGGRAPGPQRPDVRRVRGRGAGRLGVRVDRRVRQPGSWQLRI
jgi:hypothetical protein